MPIHPLLQFEADLKQLEEEDRRAYEALKAPKTIVVRFGFMKMVGEYPYDGHEKPGCGSKLVVRTHRGVEIGEMLTSTCPNSGCSKSVSRQEMLRYIENSGGRDYPFFTEGRVLRVATPRDLDGQAEVEQRRHGLRVEARRIAESLHLPLKIVEAEPLLGGERTVFFYASEERLDLRELHRRLGSLVRGRIDLAQVGARDEARITADYERCGQYCCCKNFLKVLKPISMKSAKQQKATLDPLKISGRCGRLMCCLRYEDETYEELAKKLPRKKTRVGTPEGDGTVIDGQILTQLVLVRLDKPKDDGGFNDVAIPVENLSPPQHAKAPPPAPPREPPPPRGGPQGRPPPPGQPRQGGPPQRGPGPQPGPGRGPHKPGPGGQPGGSGRHGGPGKGGGPPRGDRPPQQGGPSGRPRPPGHPDRQDRDRRGDNRGGPPPRRGPEPGQGGGPPGAPGAPGAPPTP